jgi:putative DNA methylase
MIERWFPTAEVSEASSGGWGSGNLEAGLFTWFAKRPLAQAKAAVLTSLLPWPEDQTEQQRLQGLVRRALTDRDAAHAELVAELAKSYPDGATVLDVFSGRAIIPLEAARLGLRAWGIDYSPVATLAGALLAEFPLRDWSGEPPLPFAKADAGLLHDRLIVDVAAFLAEVGRRYTAAMAAYYPRYQGRLPWGYLWAATLPCQECGRRFPLTGSMALRKPARGKPHVAQSYRIDVDPDRGTFTAVIGGWPPTDTPTLFNLTRGPQEVRGKAARCPFCQHPHPKPTHTRLAALGLCEDVLLAVADLDDEVSKRFRPPVDEDYAALEAAAKALTEEGSFGPGVPAVPNEPIPPGNNHTVRASMYGAKTYGQLCNVRQTLSFVRLSRAINDVGQELLDAGISLDYAAALSGYAGAALVRKLRRSTRGASLEVYNDGRPTGVSDLFTNEASLAFSYDYVEVGLAGGAGSWESATSRTLNVLRAQAARPPGRPATIQRGSALALPMGAGSVAAVVTDPPYDNMIDYTDASDLFFVWLKRALASTNPEFGLTTDPHGVQEKNEEIIVKEGGKTIGDHRTREFYDTSMAKAFAEAVRVVHHDGVVTTVFGHGDPDVWHRLLSAISEAGLVLTGSWPARTEKGGQAGSANIVTTLTLACRPAPEGRRSGRVNEVDAEVRRAVRERMPLWEAAGLALTDQLMASAGPAMEVVGRYSSVLNRRGDPVDLSRYLPLARRAVEEATAIKVDDLPLEVFDPRTRFALFWSRLFGRGLAPRSEARWQALAADLTLAELEGILMKVRVDKAEGVRLAYAKEAPRQVDETSSTIDVAFALAAAWQEGLAAAGEVLASAGRDSDDPHLWAALPYLSSRLPDGDQDRAAWTALVRARQGLGLTARQAATTRRQAEEESAARSRQATLFGEAEGP